jgi:sulfite reductase alpha subunit-like flavoprotein
MIGFLEDRAYALENESEEKKTDKRSTNCHFFFGFRTHDERIYRKRIMIKEKGGIICDLLLRDDCTYYICGDANMADFVYNAVVEVLRENANMSRVKATILLKRMRVEDRWQYDLWGI